MIEHVLSRKVDWSREPYKIYADAALKLYDKMKIRLHKVESHTGVFGNEVADRLAKQACGCISW